MSDEMPRHKSVPDSRILASFEHSEGPVATAPDISEQVDLSADGVRHRLQQLADDGVVECKHVGARATVWWRVDESAESTASPHGRPE